MKTNITGKNYTPSDKLKETIEKKFEKLDKYFSNEITRKINFYTKDVKTTHISKNYT